MESEEEIEGRIALKYLGDARHPERRGVIPNVTPVIDGRAGLDVGSMVLVTDELLRSLKRPTGGQAQADFALFMAGVYNANYRSSRWEVVLVIPDTESDAQGSADAVQSEGQAVEESTAQLVENEAGGAEDQDHSAESEGDS